MIIIRIAKITMLICFLIRHSISSGDREGAVASPFPTAINMVITWLCCSLVRCTAGKLINVVISLLSMSIPNVFLKNAILSPIDVVGR